jgi:hypothetical protein
MADPVPGMTLDQQVAAILAAWRDRYICPPEGHADALARVAAKTMNATTHRDFAIWLILKSNRGYYRHSNAGYTSDPARAGRYTRMQADATASIEPENFSVVLAPEAMPTVASQAAKMESTLKSILKDCRRTKAAQLARKVLDECGGHR